MLQFIICKFFFYLDWRKKQLGTVKIAQQRQLKMTTSAFYSISQQISLRWHINLGQKEVVYP